MLEKYGDKGKVWSHYLKRCFEHDSFIIPQSLKVKKKAASIRATLQALVDERTAKELADVVEVSQREEEDFPPLGASSVVMVCYTDIVANANILSLPPPLPHTHTGQQC